MNEDFEKKYGKLTVQEARELNEAASRTCEEDS